MTKIIAGWEIRRINCWYTHGITRVDDSGSVYTSRAKIEQGKDALWSVSGVVLYDHKILLQSGITAERFRGPRYAAQAVHQVLGTPVKLMRDYSQYHIGNTRWRVLHHPSWSSQQAWRVRHGFKPMKAGHDNALEAFCTEAEDRYAPTLVAAVEQFAKVAQRYNYTG